VSAKTSILVFLLSCSLSAQQTPAPANTPAQALTPAASASAPPPPPRTLLDGTPVQLRLTHTISSDSSRVGQEVPFEVVDAVSIGGFVVIPKGAVAIARVIQSSHKRSMGRGGKLNLSIAYARLADNEKVTLRAISESQGGGHVGAMTSAMVGVTIICWPAAPLLLFVRGKDVTIPAGSEITAFVDGDMPLDMAHFTTRSSASATATREASVSIDSSPSGADIEVDDAFVGVTPATVTLPAGTHQVSVHKKGFPNWTRSLNVVGSSINISADLDIRPAAR
jgi:hypothetical protein